ncbi:hypothetical protein C8Q74DRAFT_1254815 [Fomes fomentarius]|nr:hypothetical protein C8Q74DRAFT_1254815 [Fomes fomentarius]
MEEGEIDPQSTAETLYGWCKEASVDISGAVHSSSVEWPGDAEATPEFLPAGGSSIYPALPSPFSSLRLLVHRSPVLRKHYKVALLDGYPEVHIGRDIAPGGSDTPRIRLKEMEVSKLHSTIYWERDRSQWSIVDMGSKHGTFIRSAAAPTPSTSCNEPVDGEGTRLSAPRVASMPRTLHHLDRVTIGGTTFIVHIHEDKLPCTACSPQHDEEIPLFLHRPADGDTGPSKKRKVDALPPQPSDATYSRGRRDPKKALAMLKHTLLSSKLPPSSQSGVGSQPYVDRSARRLTPPPLVPLPSTNIGHIMLMKQGWQPGTALGDLSSSSGGLVAPVDPPATVGRAGIGAPVRSLGMGVAPDGAGWRDAGKRRRWQEMRGTSSDSV